MLRDRFWNDVNKVLGGPHIRLTGMSVAVRDGVAPRQGWAAVSLLASRLETFGGALPGKGGRRRDGKSKRKI